MKVISINDHIKAPQEAVLVRAEPKYGWFVVSYETDVTEVEIFYNQQGREVFQIHRPREVTKRKFWRWFNANSDSKA